MRLFKKLFPSDTDVSKLIETAKDGIDYSVFTSEEKAKAALAFHSLMLKLYEALAPFNTVMRYLACIVAAIWVFFLLALVLVGSLDAGFYVELKAIMTELVNPNFTMIMQFYFGSAVLNGALRTIVKK